MALSKDAKLEHLKAVRLFKGCTGKQLAHVAAITDEVDVEAGKVLCRQGDQAHEAFIIVSGEATIVADGRELNRVGAGEIVGEVSLIDKGPRTATVTAVTPMHLLVVTAQSFEPLLEEVPGLPVAIMRDLAHRLRSYGHH
ncbi:MAG: cyclic nucleotide-binding domain-containing protein [Actinobacteria bacterium]|nr:cyclic nucleotide-binding domain-containing protein [Actinomycetota bacterium]